MSHHSKNSNSDLFSFNLSHSESDFDNQDAIFTPVKDKFTLSISITKPTTVINAIKIFHLPYYSNSIKETNISTFKVTEANISTFEIYLFAVISNNTANFFDTFQTSQCATDNFFQSY